MEQNELRQYLLGRLTGADEERVELRLLTDDDYVEEFDIVVGELIDLYVDKKLPDADMKLMERYFFKAPERRGKLKAALALKKYQERRRRRRRLLRFYLPIAACVLVAIGLSLVVWKASSRPADLDEGLLALQNAFKEQRPIEPRISAFKSYAPAATRGPQRQADSVSLELAARLLLHASAEHPSAGTHHALGQYYLAVRRFDEAVKQFEAASSLDPQNAQIHSDLGAALLEQGKTHLAGGEPERAQGARELAGSVEQLNKALELDGTLRQALFNRALCHEAMRLPQAAEEDWRKYLELDNDPNSPWAVEAEQHLTALKELKEKSSRNKEQLWQNFLDAHQGGDEEGAWDAVERSSCRVGNCIVERLIDGYLEARLGDRPAEADGAIEKLSYVGELKTRRAGDSYTLDLSKFYKTATTGQLTVVSQSRGIVKSAQEKIAAADFNAAVKLYGRARQLFDGVGDEGEARQAEYWLAICYSRLNRRDESALLLRRLVPLFEGRGHKWLAVRSLNALADYQFSALHEYSTAISSGSRSARMAEESHDKYGLLSALSLLMELHRYLGNYDQAVGYVPRVLTASDFAEPKQTWLNYNDVSWTFNSLGLYAAAADYQKAALQLALKSGELQMICVSYVRLGVVYGNEKRFDDALATVRKALDAAGTRSGEVVGQQMFAYASSGMADLYRRAGDFERAIESYNTTVELYSKQDAPPFTYRAHKGLLLSLIAAGNTQAAREELATTLALYDKHRASIIEQSNVLSFSDVEQDVFDAAIDFEQSSLNNPEGAFNYSEMSHARSLWDLMRAGSPAESGDDSDLLLPREYPPLNLSEIRERLPERAQILQYAVLEDKVMMWVVSKNDFKTGVAQIDQKKLDGLVSAYLRLVSNATSDQNERARLANELYDILIRPVESALDRSRPLCIVPDKILNYVPYAALVSPASRRYFIEDYLIILSPSSSAFVECSLSERNRGSASGESLLSVGNPDFDRGKYDWLPDLTDADREAKRIAAYYESREILTSGQAVKSEVVNAMSRADVINIASHALVDEVNPMRSKLLLAKGSPTRTSPQPEDDVLQASEIYRMQLPRLRLVVLAACQTGVGRSYRGEGLMSIARPFIARGVPEVVASLWSVESAATAELMIKFHEARKRQGLPAADALRQAQLAMLSSPRQLYRQPYYWASFNVIGGHAGT